MTVQINYKNGDLKNILGNLVLFVGEKFNTKPLKKYISGSDFLFVNDLLKKADPKNQEPNWLTEKQYQDLRNLHNERINSQNKLTSGKKVEIRGIPTQKKLRNIWTTYGLNTN